MLRIDDILPRLIQGRENASDYIRTIGWVGAGLDDNELVDIYRAFKALDYYNPNLPAEITHISIDDYLDTCLVAAMVAKIQMDLSFRPYEDIRIIPCVWTRPIWLGISRDWHSAKIEDCNWIHNGGNQIRFSESIVTVIIGLGTVNMPEVEFFRVLLDNRDNIYYRPAIRGGITYQKLAKTIVLKQDTLLKIKLGINESLIETKKGFCPYCGGQNDSLALKKYPFLLGISFIRDRTYYCSEENAINQTLVNFGSLT